MGDTSNVVVAKYDYAAQDAQELAIRKNERLVLLDDSRSWWRVRNSAGQSGFVPSNYVKRLKPSILDSLKSAVAMSTLGRRSKGGSTSGDSPQHQQPLASSSKDFGSLSQLRAGGGNAHTGSHATHTCDNFFVVAKFSYSANQDDELSFKKGERLLVVEKSNDGWWKGEKASKESGWFPSNYVEEDPADGSGGELSVTYTNPAAFEAASRGSDEAVPQEVAVTLYAFTGTSDEELSFDKDEQLVIIDKPSEEPQWLRARNALGRTGLVPCNYVRLRPAAASAAPATAAGTALLLSHSVNGGSSNSRGSISCNPGDLRNRYAAEAGGRHIDRDWFYGRISRSECENVLLQYGTTGDFLIRESESKAGDVTVSVHAYGNKIRHFLISCSLADDRFQIGQQSFGSLEELVEHYKRHPIFRSDSEKLYLIKPVKCR